jgi:hypothetical protein
MGAATGVSFVLAMIIIVLHISYAQFGGFPLLSNVPRSVANIFF